MRFSHTTNNLNLELEKKGIEDLLIVFPIIVLFSFFHYFWNVTTLLS